MKRHRLKRMVCRLETWKHDVLVLVGGTELQAEAEVVRFLRLPERVVQVGTAIGRTWRFDDQPTAMWMRSIHRPSDMPILMHEAWHAVSHILRSRGVEPSAKSEEAFCYTAEELVRAVLTCRKWQTVKAR